MNIQNLKENYNKLIDYMKQHGYSEQYRYTIEHEVKSVIRLSENHGCTTYADVYRKYEESNYTTKTLKNRRSLLSLVENFDKYELYPNHTYRFSSIRDVSYNKLCDDFKSLIDCYQSIKDKSEAENKIIKDRSSRASTFLLSLQNNGINNLEKITEKEVLAVLTKKDGSPKVSSSQVQNIRKVFETCIPFYLNGLCEKVSNYIPSIKDNRKNVHYLTREEIDKLHKVLTDFNISISLRDRAICILFLYTGLRNCDVASLKLADIDWDNDVIYVVQNKTGIALELPLLAIVGNTLYDYITLERPKTNIPEVFVSITKPYKKFKSLSGIIDKIMDVAQIRMNEKERRGTHLFRHNVVTTLLRNGTTAPIISNIVGQTIPSSLEPYLHADFKHLKECALSIKKFPLKMLK